MKILVCLMLAFFSLLETVDAQAGVSLGMREQVQQWARERPTLSLEVLLHRMGQPDVARFVERELSPEMRSMITRIASEDPQARAGELALAIADAPGDIAFSIHRWVFSQTRGVDFAAEILLSESSRGTLETNLRGMLFDTFMYSSRPYEASPQTFFLLHSRRLFETIRALTLFNHAGSISYLHVGELLSEFARSGDRSGMNNHAEVYEFVIRQLVERWRAEGSGELGVDFEYTLANALEGYLRHSSPETSPDFRVVVDMAFAAAMTGPHLSREVLLRNWRSLRIDEREAFMERFLSSELGQTLTPRDLGPELMRLWVEDANQELSLRLAAILARPWARFVSPMDASIGNWTFLSRLRAAYQSTRVFDHPEDFGPERAIFSQLSTAAALHASSPAARMRYLRERLDGCRELLLMPRIYPYR